MLLSLAVSSYSQNDSIMYLKDIDLSFYSMQKLKYRNTGEIKLERQLTNLEDVRTLSFLRNDSMALFVNEEVPVYTKLSEINDVTKYEYRVEPTEGFAYGAVFGGLLGGFTGLLVSGYFSKHSIGPFGNLNEHNEILGGFIGALIGAVTGGIVGTVIASGMNYLTLDLFSVPEKDKKSKLIKFLNHK